MGLRRRKNNGRISTRYSCIYGTYWCNAFHASNGFAYSLLWQYKTRTAGFGFLAVGAALAYFTLMNFDDVHFGNAFISFLGGMIGGILGIIIFLVAIIKS